MMDIDTFQYNELIDYSVRENVDDEILSLILINQFSLKKKDWNSHEINSWERKKERECKRGNFMHAFSFYSDSSS